MHRRALTTAVVFALLGPSAAAAAPPNDSFDHAQAVTRLPAAIDGTTEGARLSKGEPRPSCAPLRGLVWYQVAAPRRGPMVVRVRAGGELDGIVAVYRHLRSKTSGLTCRRTDRRGRATVSWYAHKDGSYYIGVGRRTGSAAGTFRLTVLAAESPPRPPGDTLPPVGTHSMVDPILDAEDAWALPMESGRTYRVNLTTARGCLSLAIYRPRTYRFSLAKPVHYRECGGYTVFTPGPDGGGVYSIVVRAEGYVPVRRAYRLQAAAAGPDDGAPGIKLDNGRSIAGTIFGRGIDAVDLYRFNVPRENELTSIDLQQRPNVGLDLVLMRDTGERVACACDVRGRQVLREHLSPGHYIVAVRSREKSGGKYRLQLLIRDVTTTSLSVAGSRFVEFAPGVSVPFAVFVTSASHGGPVRLQIDRFDPLSGWQFSTIVRASVTPTGAATIAWTPPYVGHWRARARFTGTPFSSFSESGWVRIYVAEPLE
jgi:hypothetical protein